MSVRFQVTEKGLNGVTRESWRQTRQALVELASDKIGDSVLRITTDFTKVGSGRDGVVSLNGFTVRTKAFARANELLPETIDVEAVDAYGATLIKPVPITTQERHAF